MVAPLIDRRSKPFLKEPRTPLRYSQYAFPSTEQIPTNCPCGFPGIFVRVRCDGGMRLLSRKADRSQIEEALVIIIVPNTPFLSSISGQSTSGLPRPLAVKQPASFAVFNSLVS